MTHRKHRVDPHELNQMQSTAFLRQILVSLVLLLSLQILE
jgi:hypothetical protein